MRRRAQGQECAGKQRNSDEVHTLLWHLFGSGCKEDYASVTSRPVRNLIWTDNSGLNPQSCIYHRSADVAATALTLESFPNLKMGSCSSTIQTSPRADGKDVKTKPSQSSSDHFTESLSLKNTTALVHAASTEHATSQSELSTERGINARHLNADDDVPDDEPDSLGRACTVAAPAPNDGELIASPRTVLHFLHHSNANTPIASRAGSRRPSLHSTSSGDESVEILDHIVEDHTSAAVQ